MEVKLVKIRYIGGAKPGFEHVMKEELAHVLERRGQVEIVRTPGRKASASAKARPRRALAWRPRGKRR